MPHKRKYLTPVVEEAPEPPPEPVKQTVELRFTAPVEVYINGVPYVGQTVIAPDYIVATEIVRNAKNYYGEDII